MVVSTIEEIRDRSRASLGLPEPAARRAIRKNAGVTVRELAAVVGVSRQAVNLWETGKRKPSGDYLTRYVEALDACRGAA
jgi:DNA-binding XRE family transcriptional regulator